MSMGFIASFMMMVMGFAELISPYGSGVYTEVIMSMWFCGACICVGCGK